jgi:hypothetical protein
VILWFPKTRDRNGQPESSDVWGFALDAPVERLASLLEAWVVTGKHPGLILGEPELPAGVGHDVAVSLLNPTWTLAAPSAATMNGLDGPDPRRIVAIGAGTLGSQVIMNLFRAGFGTWTIIDDDRLLPHNLARHALDGFSIGLPKAVAMADQAHSTRETDPRPGAIVANLLDARDKEAAVSQALAACDCIIDLSASVPVARSIARRDPFAPRRLSAFLNPSGTDLVLLVEDEGRACRLDHLEHQLYRELITNPDLANHLKREPTRHRYARSCRDVSSTLPQDLASLHAGIASRGIRKCLAGPNAAIHIWRATSDLAVSTVRIDPEPVVEYAMGEWTVCSDRRFFDKIAKLRLAKLPNETGGVLLGSFDLERKIIYLVETIPSPPDSEEWPTLYIRGSEGLAAQVQQVSEITTGMLQYVGEWHSHPCGVAAIPSTDDCTVFAWITELMDRDGFPAVMLIAADSRSAVFVGRMQQGKEPW